MKTIFLVMLLSSMSFAQMRPLPALCMADEPDIHQRFVEALSTPTVKPEIVFYANTTSNEKRLLDKLDYTEGKVTVKEMEILGLHSYIQSIEEDRKLEKKYAGIAGLLLFASGNESLKNIGLVSLFCYSIW